MKATYYQRGETLDYTPAEDVANGEVVSLGTRVGVAAAPILAGEQGAVHVVGVFFMPKVEGEPIIQGTAVYYDSAADAITATAEVTVAKQSDGDEEDTTPTKIENTPVGYAAASAAATDSAVLVKLLG